MRYLNLTSLNEAVPGLHFNPADIPHDVIALPSEHWFWQPLPAGHKVVRSGDGIDCILQIDERTVDQLRQDAIKSIEAFAARVRSIVAGTSDPIEVAGWPNKRAIAERIASNQGSAEDIAAIDAEIERRGLGESQSQFVAKILANAVRFSYVTGVIDGIKRRALDSVFAAGTANDIATAINKALASANAELAALGIPLEA